MSFRGSLGEFAANHPDDTYLCVVIEGPGKHSNATAEQQQAVDEWILQQIMHAVAQCTTPPIVFLCGQGDPPAERGVAHTIQTIYNRVPQALGLLVVDDEEQLAKASKNWAYFYMTTADLAAVVPRSVVDANRLKAEIIAECKRARCRPHVAKYAYLQELLKCYLASTAPFRDHCLFFHTVDRSALQPDSVASMWRVSVKLGYYEERALLAPFTTQEENNNDKKGET